MADTPDLGSGAARHGGSSPPFRTIFLNNVQILLIAAACLLGACSNKDSLSRSAATAFEIESSQALLDTQRYVNLEKKRTLTWQQSQRTLITSLEQSLTEKEDHQEDQSQWRDLDTYQIRMRYEAGARYPQLEWRLKDNPTSIQYVLLGNYLEQWPGSMITSLAFSPIQPRVALALSSSYSQDEAIIIIQDFISGQQQAIQTNQIGALVWNVTGKGLFFSTRTKGVAQSVFLQPVFSEKTPILIFQVGHKDSAVSISRSTSGAYLLLKEYNNQFSSFFEFPLEEQTGSAQSIFSDTSGLTQKIDHYLGQFFILETTTDGRSRVLSSATSVPLQSPHELLTTSPAQPIIDFAFSNQILTFLQRTHSQIQLESIDPKSKIRWEKPAYPAASLAFTPRLGTSTNIALTMSNPTSAPVACSLAELSMRCQNSASQAAPFTLENLTVISSDGTQVPLTLILPKNWHTSADRKIVAKVYAAYGVALDTHYDPEIATLLERGVAVALVHARGGGELGEIWHRAATRRDKLRTFQDFHAALELLRNKYAPRTLIGYGRSAGGLVVANILLQHPELLDGAVLENPFVSVVDTISDDSQPASVRERAEWGDPNDPKELDVMHSYDPYFLPIPQKLPSLFVQLSLADEAVKAESVLGWTAKLRAVSAETNMLIDISDTASHSGERYQADENSRVARKLAWIIAAGSAR